MRWIPAVLLIVLATMLIACEPEYVEPSALEPLEGAAAISTAADEIDVLLVEHDARIADFYSRIASSEEQLAFDVTRAKRRLVGNSDSIRRDVDTMIDVHEHDALTEIARAKRRIGTFDEVVHTAAAEQLNALALIDPLDHEASRLDAIVANVGNATDIGPIEGIVIGAQERTVQASDSIENELNKLATRTSLN